LESARSGCWVALINTIGVTAGIFGPVVVGAAKDAGSLEAGLGPLALVLLGGAALAVRLPFAAREPTLELRTAVS
jgi:hypothetical protein